MLVPSHSNVLWFDLEECGNAICSFVKSLRRGSVVIPPALKPSHLGSYVLKLLS